MTTPNPDWLDRSLFPFESRFVDVAGQKVHYVDEGSGPTLLLLHGNPTWSFLYRHLIRLLAPRFRCVALDYPGFGLSEATPTYGYTPREHSCVVDGVIDALGLTDITLMVQDWGGPIGLGVAGRRPELVQALVIGNAFAWPAGRSRGLATFSRIIGGRLARYLITRHNALVRWLIPAGVDRTLTDAEMAAYTDPFPTPEARLPTWIFVREIRRSEAYLCEVEAGLARLADKPTLIVWGDADGAFRAPDRDRFAKLFPHNRVVNLRGAKHFIQENAPDEIAKAIVDWHHRET